MTRLAGLIGHPVAHSISPRFQQAAFDRCAIDVRYELWDTPTDALADRVHGLRRSEVLGANVTIPHKQAVLSLVDRVAPEVELTGAANTIVNRDGTLMAHNTDVGGFSRALEGALKRQPTGFRVVVIGAGGTARAVLAALSSARAASVLIVNRSSERAVQLSREMGPKVAPALEAAPLDASVSLRLAGSDLIVNCTSVGLAGSDSATQSPLDAQTLPSGAVIVDVVANPLETPFIRLARERGHLTLGGLPMLVQQGALSFELWTGRAAPVEVMMAAAHEAMRLVA